MNGQRLIGLMTAALLAALLTGCPDPDRRRAAVGGGEGKLKESGKTGLLDAPLPEGAKLLRRHEPEPGTNQDPREEYAVEATAGGIATFFEQAMPRHGWTKGKDSRRDMLFFDKGNLTIGVLIDDKGGSFTLMGS